VSESRTAATSHSGVDSPWYPDLGATDHITGELDKLTMHEPYTGTDQIHATNSYGMAINHIYTSIIPTSSCNLTLNNVLHVLTAHKNLLSVHRFTLDNDTFIEFHPYFFVIKDRKHGRCCCTGHVRGGGVFILFHRPHRSFASSCSMSSKSLVIDGMVVLVIPRGILSIVSLARIICHTQPLIILFGLCVMPAPMLRHTNCHIQCRLVVPPLL
jgi:hypothetical protein